MDKLLKIGKFIRLIDESNRLSLTNIALMIGLYKIASTNGVNLNDAGLLFATLANYAHKKYLSKE